MSYLEHFMAILIWWGFFGFWLVLLWSESTWEELDTIIEVMTDASIRTHPRPMD